MGVTRSRFDALDFWEKRLQRFDLAAVGYTGLGLRYNEWLYRVRSVVFRRMLRGIDLIPRSSRVLDVGSGTGFYITEWLQAGAQVVASDLTRLATERLATDFPEVEVVQLDISAAPPFSAGSFDAVSAFDVLFHIVDESAYRCALHNLALLLREGGYLLFSENFLHGPPLRSQHQVSRSLAEIEELLNEAGFEVVSRRPMFVLMNAPLDSKGVVLRQFWQLLRRVVKRNEVFGAALGAMLFPFELLLISIRREGPSTEAMVCRRRPEYRP
jgi:SAM-dependent methyltransferase